MMVTPAPPVFCAAGTRVVEIHYPRYTLGLYWQMAERLGLRYGAVRGVQLSDNPTTDPRRTDMHVDAEAAAAYVAAMLSA